MGNIVPDRPIRLTSQSPSTDPVRPGSQPDADDASWAGLDIPPWHLSRYTVAVCLRPDGTTVGEHRVRPRWFQPLPSGPTVSAGSAQTRGGVS